MALKYACFVSYAHGQHELIKTFVEELVESLKSSLEPYLDEEVYVDYDRLRPGFQYDEALAEAICQSLCMIVVYCPRYERHEYCLRELAAMEKLEAERRALLGQAAHGRRLIIPVIFRGNLQDLPPRLVNGVQYCDLSSFTLADPRLSSNPSFAGKIDEICQIIAEYYRLLQEPAVAAAATEGCKSFRIPSGADAPPLRPAAACPQDFPGREGERPC